MLESSFFDFSDHYRPDDSVSERPQGNRESPGGDVRTPCFHVRLAFGDGARVDMLGRVTEGRVVLEEMGAGPPLSVVDPGAARDDWAEGALAADYSDAGPFDAAPRREEGREGAAGRRARPAWPRGVEGRRGVAETYRAAQAEGRDPVLAVMCATGRSRRRSLRLIAAARDAGFLAPRHNRR
ncbi:DUF6214 family protein [Streptomyces sp. NPDC050400]|uniref:DUF6214 family protein n=1 Tax=Streptomyces sp. NPDC050400 TaxID=3365610 RepID=UPI0037A5FD16